MSRFLRDIQRSFKLKLKRVFFDGGTNRQLQEQMDIHRIFLYTSLHEHRHLLEGRLPYGFTEHLIEQAKSLSFEQQRHFVHQQLCGQLVDIASSIHTSLVQVQDPRPSASAFERAWQQLHPKNSSSSSSSSSTGMPGRLLSQRDLSHMVQQKLGYSLAVQPSNIAHQEAGMGLFVQGSVIPGSLLALFPGLVYHKGVYRRMPGYPCIDVGNPYLTARYDGGVVDSLPWGRGWAADGQVAAATGPVAPRSKGLIGRMVAASDGPVKPIPETRWVKATTAEAAYLELLEGRHPLALAHYANHPPAGVAPNAVIASFKFNLRDMINLELSRETTKDSSNDSTPSTITATTTSSSSSSSFNKAPSSSSGSSDGGSSSSSSDFSGRVGPWLRAYVPNIEYYEECSPEQLLNMEVSCVGLVAVAPLQAGSEVLFNYRLSPALMGRPAWYVPVDPTEENMRWA